MSKGLFQFETFSIFMHGHYVYLWRTRRFKTSFPLVILIQNIFDISLTCIVCISVWRTWSGLRRSFKDIYVILRSDRTVILPLEIITSHGDPCEVGSHKSQVCFVMSNSSIEVPIWKENSLWYANKQYARYVNL